jgi:hypothetical protein
MNQKVGRITLAVALIVLGGVLIADTWQGTQITSWVARLWPGLLILLGLEWIAAATRGESPRVDGGAIALLVIVALVASSYGSFRRGPVRRQGFSWQAPSVPAVPSVPVPPAVPRLFGDVAEEVVLNHEGDAKGMRALTVNGEGVGDIRVEQGDKFRVELRVTGYGRDAASARENAGQFRLDIRPEGESTRVGVTRPAQSQKFGLVFTITVPPEVGVNLETSSGTIAVTGRTGNVQARTSSGSIDVQNAGGKVSAQSSSGNISLITDRVGGEYDLTASSGNVRLTIPASAGVSLDARTSSGTVTGPSWLTLGEGRGSATGTQGDGTYKITVRTSSGSIQVDAR